MAYALQEQLLVEEKNPTFQWILRLHKNILFRKTLDIDVNDFVLSNTCSRMIERQLAQLQN